MSSYLRFFELQRAPFETQAQSKLVLGTKALRDAYAQIQAGLEDSAARICVSGGAGLGKTSLARALPKLLRDEAHVVVLLNPSLPWSTLRTAIVKQLSLEGDILSRQTLMAACTGDKRIVLVIDSAERIQHESLEQLDSLLAYQSNHDKQLVHCVMLANLEKASEDRDCPLLWWLDSLHTLQLEFAPIPASGVEVYIAKHLKRAGWKGQSLFTTEASHAVHRLTGGIPRKVSELCEKVLEIAANRSIQPIEPALVEEVAGEPLSEDEIPQLLSEPPKREPAEAAAASSPGADPLDSFFGQGKTPSALTPEPRPPAEVEATPAQAEEPESDPTAAFETQSPYAASEDRPQRWPGKIAILGTAAVCVVLAVGISWMQLSSSDAERAQAEKTVRGQSISTPAASGDTRPDDDIRRALGRSIAAGQNADPETKEDGKRVDGAAETDATGDESEPAVVEEYVLMHYQEDRWAGAIREAVMGGRASTRTSASRTIRSTTKSSIQAPAAPAPAASRATSGVKQSY